MTCKTFVSFIEKRAARETKHFGTENMLASLSNQSPILLSQGGLPSIAFPVHNSCFITDTGKAEL